ncbi:hypothetical protein SAMN05421780_101580 [Flexibacter flexilis DSM 6793]|uniref:Uncharacterized protein n=1 Tax=Flexibacter flexilis DSM 6793 TaxID=927664 RepID=A0A1I1E703_9BACT|nr:hypothetical protein [Flexibacter flexilis]SFB81068.1 hypothetical protein SAMN05421780_101580 [Flexibacter flexilis DSM 6793]
MNDKATPEAARVYELAEALNEAIAAATAKGYYIRVWTDKPLLVQVYIPVPAPKQDEPHPF